MPWLAAVGFAIVGTAVSVGFATVVGGIVVGAAIGALYSAVTGGNILKGVLYGAIGGAVVGGVGAAMGLGTAAAGSTGVATAEVGVAGTTLGGTTAELGGTLTAASTTGIAEAGAGASLFSAEGLSAASSLMTAGSAFMAGGQQLDPDAQMALAREKMESDERIAAMRGGGSTSLEETRLRIASGEKLAASDLLENARQFDESLQERIFEDRETRKEEEEARGRFEVGILEASEYMESATETVSVVESSSQRRDLPAPVWRGESKQPVAEGATA
jgi:hypothetical protein